MFLRRSNPKEGLDENPVNASNSKCNTPTLLSKYRHNNNESSSASSPSTASSPTVKQTVEQTVEQTVAAASHSSPVSAAPLPSPFLSSRVFLRSPAFSSCGPLRMDFLSTYFPFTPRNASNASKLASVDDQELDEDKNTIHAQNAPHSKDDPPEHNQPPPSSSSSPLPCSSASSPPPTSQTSATPETLPKPSTAMDTSHVPLRKPTSQLPPSHPKNPKPEEPSPLSQHYAILRHTRKKHQQEDSTHRNPQLHFTTPTPDDIGTLYTIKLTPKAPSSKSPSASVFKSPLSLPPASSQSVQTPVRNHQSSSSALMSASKPPVTLEKDDKFYNFFGFKFRRQPSS